jgi:hypothetical protein
MRDTYLKYAAIIFMVVDHVGVLVNSEYFRLIGRASFPIFIYLLNRGYHNTKNYNKYLFRLSLFALISQLPYWMFFKDGLNIFFTLVLALLCLRWRRWYLWLASAFFADLLHFGYGYYGIFLAWLFNSRGSLMPMYFSVLHLVYSFLYPVLSLQIFALYVSLGLYYFGDRFSLHVPDRLRLAYWFYPVHLFFFALLRWWWVGGLTAYSPR